MILLNPPLTIVSCDLLLSVYCVLRCYSGRDKVNCRAIKYNVYIICFRRDIFTIVYLLIVCSSLKCSQCSQLSGLIVSLYLESEKQSSLDSSITPPSQTSMGHQHASAPCLASHVTSGIRVTQCSMLTWVFKLFIFYLNNINLSNSEGPKPKHKYPAKINCHLDSRARPGRQWPLSYEHWTNNKWPSPLLTQEMWVKRKSGHLTPVTVVGSPSIALMRNSPSHLMPWSQECTHQTNTLLTIFT